MMLLHTVLIVDTERVGGKRQAWWLRRRRDNDVVLPDCKGGDARSCVCLLSERVDASTAINSLWQPSILSDLLCSSGIQEYQQTSIKSLLRSIIRNTSSIIPGRI
jgi:hypothetical protein